MASVVLSIILDLLTIFCEIQVLISITDCPDPWITYEGSCYKFVFYPTKYYPEAKMTCMVSKRQEYY